MALVFLFAPLIEIFLFYKFVQAYSLGDLILYLVGAGLLGALIILIQGRVALFTLQMELAQGKMPSDAILHRGLAVIGGILFLVPGFLSDALAILCIAPGVRHLFIVYLKKRFHKSVQMGNVHFYSAGQSFRREKPMERDAEVVDVTPLEITHKQIDDD